PSADIYTLSLHDALPIWVPLTQGKTALVDARDWERVRVHAWRLARQRAGGRQYLYAVMTIGGKRVELGRFVLGSRAGRRVRHKKDRKSTRLNSSHVKISY